MFPACYGKRIGFSRDKLFICAKTSTRHKNLQILHNRAATTIAVATIKATAVLRPRTARRRPPEKRRDHHHALEQNAAAPSSSASCAAAMSLNSRRSLSFTWRPSGDHPRDFEQFSRRRLAVLSPNTARSRRRLGVDRHEDHLLQRQRVALHLRVDAVVPL